MEPRTKTRGPYPGGLIWTHTQLGNLEGGNGPVALAGDGNLLSARHVYICCRQHVRFGHLVVYSLFRDVGYSRDIQIDPNHLG